jgi:hypothetical protein
MKREEILKKSIELTMVDRAEDYGSWYDNAEDIGVMWGVILGFKKHDLPDPSPEQVALMMDAVKTVRLSRNPKHLDSWTDKAGYSALGGETSSESK